MSVFWIDFEDGSGNKIGAGPLAFAGGMDIVRRLDQAGTFQVREVPASDYRSSYITEKRTARAYTLINQAVIDLGGGIIDEIAVRPVELMLQFRGSDLLRELTYRQVGSLAIDDGAGGADVTGPQDIIALAPSGWTLDDARGFDTTAVAVLHTFEGETVLQALIRLAEITGEHFYLGTGRTLVWIRATGSAKLKYTASFGTFAAGDTVTGFTSGATGYCVEQGNDGASDWLYLSGVSGRFLDSETITGSPSSAQGVTTAAYNPSSGLRAVQGGDTVALEGNAEICVITNLERVNDSYDLITRVYPYGAGDGDARVTLDGATWTPPSGYSISTGSNYIKRDAGETGYGQIERYLQFKDIDDPDTLAEAAYNWLRVMSYPLHAYRLEVAGLVGTLNPGQTIRVIYHRWIDGYHAIDIDEDLIVLETTTRIDARGARTVALEVSTLDRWALDDAAALVSGLSGAQAAYTHPQPISGSTGGTAHTHLADDVTDFDEAAQDAIGGILIDSNTIDLSYEDGVPSIAADYALTGPGDVLAAFQALPSLRGYWPLSSADEAGNVYDLSGQNRKLTNTNGVTFGVDGLAAYGAFVAASNQYFTRPDEAGLDITGALTFGGWFWINSLGAAYTPGGKWYTSGDQRSFTFIKNASDQVQFSISSDGTSGGIVTAISAAITEDAWHFVIGRYTPSTELAVFVDGVKVPNTTGIPAAIFNSSEAFEIGRSNRAGYLDGRWSMVFVCAAALSDTLLEHLWNRSRLLFGV